jgi:hypothetical protein
LCAMLLWERLQSRCSGFAVWLSSELKSSRAQELKSSRAQELKSSRAFHPPAEGESLFSCAAKRKVTKREGHPAWRLPGIPARQVREAGPGFSTGLLSWRKGIDIHVDPPAGLSTPPHRRTGAPGRAARVVRALLKGRKAERPKCKGQSARAKAQGPKRKGKRKGQCLTARCATSTQLLRLLAQCG